MVSHQADYHLMKFSTDVAHRQSYKLGHGVPFWLARWKEKPQESIVGGDPGAQGVCRSLRRIGQAAICQTRKSVGNS